MLGRTRAMTSRSASFTPVYSLIRCAKFADGCAQGGYICGEGSLTEPGLVCWRSGPPRLDSLAVLIQNGPAHGRIPTWSARLPPRCLKGQSRLQRQSIEPSGTTTPGGHGPHNPECDLPRLFPQPRSTEHRDHPLAVQRPVGARPRGGPQGAGRSTLVCGGLRL